VTDVVSLEASVIEAAEAIDEIWHMVKPRNGSSGWLLAGIQQTQ